MLGIAGDQVGLIHASHNALGILKVRLLQRDIVEVLFAGKPAFSLHADDQNGRSIFRL
ncbi:hypothetical protein ACFOLL_15810 [Falsochrobactrum ovis]|uniref:hypothetical protein n=1 Tax=Falsochrobactrum ovis TaxID=1293442 RepID=UPI0013145C5C|nr:hypothetical protein [Falsochrobactrum ovis]